MWIYTRRRSEHDIRYMVNLALCSRVQISQLGERWFVEVILGAEAVPVAAVATQEEAMGLVDRIFEGIRSAEKAVDLQAEPEARSQPALRERNPPQRKEVTPPEQKAA